MTGLRRDLGFWEMTAVAASMMLGAGIFFGPSVTAREFPNGGLVLLFWALGGLVALAGAWVFGRMASFFPFSGGPYVYVREAYGGFPAFLFAWTSFSIIAPTSMAVMAHIFGEHLGKLSPLGPTGVGLVGLWGITAATFVNFIGVKSGGRTQDFLTGLKVVLVAGLILILFRGASHADIPSIQGTGRFGTAFTGVLFAIGGWEYAVLASEEVRDPERTIPRALMAGTGLVVLLYLLLVGGYLAALGASGVGSAAALAPEAAERVLPGSSRFVALLVGISALGTLNAVCLLGPRATFALARDGLAPAAVARLSPRWATPTAALLLNALLTTVYLVSGKAVIVAGYTVMGTGIFIILSAVALPKLRRLADPTPHPVRDRAENAAAYLVALAFLAFIIFQLVELPVPTLVGLGIVAAGAVPYWVFRRLGYVRGDGAKPQSAET